jgi:hypothetical protein
MLKRLVLMICLLAASGAFAEDRLELDATAIKGNRELPKVLYIVPWKSAKLGALAGGSEEGSFGADWRPVDRHVFRRHVEYFDMALGQEKAR